MSFKKGYLKQLLLREELIRHEFSFTPLRKKDIAISPFYEQLKDIYRELNGQLEDAPVLPAFPDFATATAFISFDEELSFNRYRLVTLRAPFYKQLPLDSSRYKRFCRQFEQECIKKGMVDPHFTSSQSEKLFGPSGTFKYLDEKGPPKWKERAYKNMLLDMNTLFRPIKHIRISIYDEVMVKGKLQRLQDLIMAQDEEADKLIVKHVKKVVEKVNS